MLLPSPFNYVRPCTFTEPGPPEEDETYETCVQETNMVYQLKGEVLTPVKSFWGAPLRHELLNPKTVSAENTEIIKDRGLYCCK